MVTEQCLYLQVQPSGSFVNTIPTSQLVDTSETFNHDDDDSTDELAVFSFFLLVKMIFILLSQIL